MPTEYHESKADPNSFEDVLDQTGLELLARGLPYVFLTVDEAPEDERTPDTDGLVITARVGNGINNADLTRKVLAKALKAIPE